MTQSRIINVTNLLTSGKMESTSEARTSQHASTSSPHSFETEDVKNVQFPQTVGDRLGHRRSHF